MVLSMTGYGQAFIERETYRIHVEMKSINHRFSELNIRMPRQFLFLEDRLKKQVNQYIQRGKIDVFLTLVGEGLVERTLQVDWNLLNEYYKIYHKAEDELGIKQQINLEKLLLHPDIVTVVEKENQSETLISDIVAATERAALALVEMRQKEGMSLAVDLKQRLETIDSLTSKIALYAPKVLEAYYERLVKRVQDFLTGKLDIEENRLLTEVAIFADKANVDEELTRLNSHVNQFLSIIEQRNDLAVGRKLDFLVQEMNREANTIGSKSSDIHINKQVVELKAELEKIKEQVQNIE